MLLLNDSVKLSRLLTALAITSACIGCASAEREGVHYDNSFRNVTPDAMTAVKIDWDSNGRHFTQQLGRVPPAVYHYVGVSAVEAPYPIPDEVIVTWKTKDGTLRHQTVKVASRIPDIDRFKGSIFYQFSTDGVVIIPRSYAYQERNVAQGKAAVP
ncbi:MAG TPA: hypothetical protein VFE47_02835 [Tepidisphaeraceae bacterium]|jgi:hypothetical protein|nr:hypothetical protein [Tepidisphaeraceae bacterium]